MNGAAHDALRCSTLRTRDWNVKKGLLQRNMQQPQII